MIVLPIHVLVLIVGWRKYSDMRPIDAGHYVRKAGFEKELFLLLIGFGLVGEPNPDLHLTHQCQSDASDGATNCRLVNSNQFTNGRLECPRRIIAQCEQELQIPQFI